MRPLTKTFKTGSVKGKTGNGRPYTRYKQTGQNDPGGTREWRQASQFQITTTDESDTDETEHSSKPEMTANQRAIQDELQKLKNEAEIAAREKKEMENRLEKMLKELEESKSSHKNRDRADVNTRIEIVFTQTRKSKCVKRGSKWEVIGIAERRIRFVSQA